MTARGRSLMVLVGAGGLGALLVWAVWGLPAFGTTHHAYAAIVDRLAFQQRNVTNAVTAVVFDVRGFDTMAEEFILFASVVGVVLLLRQARDEREEDPEHTAGARTSNASDAVRAVGLVWIGPTVVLGAYIVINGLLTPGGGFQGGVILAAGPILVFLSDTFLTFLRVSPVPMLEAAEGVGTGLYVLVGLGTLAAGGVFLQNLLPAGRTGLLDSGGFMGILNAGVGLAVAAGVVLLLSEFLEQTLVIRGGGGG